jgi:hypothetical protein
MSTVTSGVKGAIPGKLLLAGGRTVNLLVLPQPAGKRGDRHRRRISRDREGFSVCPDYEPFAIMKDARERGAGGRVRLPVRPRGGKLACWLLPSGGAEPDRRLHGQAAILAHVFPLGTPPLSEGHDPRWRPWPGDRISGHTPPEVRAPGSSRAKIPAPRGNLAHRDHG